MFLRTVVLAFAINIAPISPDAPGREPQLTVKGPVVGLALSAGGLPSDGDLITPRSTDGGNSRSKGVRVNDVAGVPTEGLHTLAADTTGHLFAAWLDKRGGRGTQLFGAQSTDGGLTW